MEVSWTAEDFGASAKLLADQHDGYHSSTLYPRFPLGFPMTMDPKTMTVERGPAIAADDTKNVVSSIKRQLSYVFLWNRRFRILEELVKQLMRERDRVKQLVVDAYRIEREVSGYITSWLRYAEIQIDKAMKLLVRRNLKTLYQFNKKADKKAAVIAWLVETATGWDWESFDKEIAKALPSGYEFPASRLQILDQIMDALKDPQLNTIGVYGQKGVGKTTLANEVEAKAKQEKMFESVVLLAKFMFPSVKGIQAEIAYGLDLKFDTADVLDQASQLYQRLMKQKVLIILDTVWEELDLNTVGIPSGDSPQGCKLLLISREVDVLREIGTQKEFFLDLLGDEEARRFFCALAPQSLDPKFRDIATKLCRYCEGVPERINEFACRLKDEELHEWKAMLHDLSRSVNRELYEREYMFKLESMLQKVPAWSSENQHEKSLLLLCSMFEHSNIEIQRLLIYSMGLDWYENTVTVREARNRLFTLINELKSKSLLLDGDVDGFVQMPDAVCRDAISIASKSHHVFVGEGRVQLRDQIDRKCTKIVLPYCNISELPSSLECPELDLFLLFTDDLSLKMPNSFFERMINLKVVDFTGMRFMSLPSSLGLLTNLRTLSLHRCRLHNASFIGKIKWLEQLSFAYSTIFKLPREIQELTKLKLLDLSHCTVLRVVPANVLSKLCQLEALYMLASFHQWGTDGNASLVELKNLDKLSILEIQIKNSKLIPGGLEFFDGLKLEHFRISYGDIYSLSGGSTIPRSSHESEWGTEPGESSVSWGSH